MMAFSLNNKRMLCVYIWMSKKRLRNILCLLRVKKTKYLSDVFCTLWVSKRRLRNILHLLRLKKQNIFLTSFVRYRECPVFFHWVGPKIS